MLPKKSESFCSELMNIQVEKIDLPNFQTRKTSAYSNRVTEKSSSRWFAGFLSSTKCFFLRTDSALRHTVDSFFWLYFYLMNYQESLVISIVVFLEVGLNF